MVQVKMVLSIWSRHGFERGEELEEGILEEEGDQDLNDSMKCRYMVFYLCFVSPHLSDFVSRHSLVFHCSLDIFPNAS